VQAEWYAIEDLVRSGIIADEKVSQFDAEIHFDPDKYTVTEDAKSGGFRVRVLFDTLRHDTYHYPTYLILCSLVIFAVLIGGGVVVIVVVVFFGGGYDLARKIEHGS
jgi:hypothetical protein